MEHFTPVSATAGGISIGLSAAMLWLGIGRIAGISGIVGSLLTPHAGDIAWRAMFIAGLVLAPVLYRMAGGATPEIVLPNAPAVIALGGLLVGFGTRLGGGCTSGHGVCGVARLSPRSLAATLLFMASGFATVFVARHLLGA
ncbi:MAG TPA: YeeE/YedE family protein [Stellaceae bacterium]|nr:YeeE/YedE family protein [Stellaceae bacterium]